MRWLLVGAALILAGCAGSEEVHQADCIKSKGENSVNNEWACDDGSFNDCWSEKGNKTWEWRCRR